MSKIQNNTKKSLVKDKVLAKHLDTLETIVPICKINATNILRKRQRSKAISTSVNGKLCYLNSPLHKSYQAAYYCNEHIFQDGKKVTSLFCKRRSCIICSRVYAAKLYAAYSKPLLDLPDLHFVTVTDVNVKADNLSNEIDRMLYNYRLIYKSMNARGMRIRGFFKLEITHSTRRNDFNPHIHLLISGKENAKEFLKGWLQRNPTAKKSGQNISKVTSENALIEVFKYVTKATIKDTFDARSMDAMYQAISCRQVYRGLGIKKEINTNFDKVQSMIIDHRSERIEVWKWCRNRKDWYTIQGENFNDNEIDLKAQRMIQVVEDSPNHVLNSDHRDKVTTDFNHSLNKFRGKNPILF
jgi:hypothetical protein